MKKLKNEIKEALLILDLANLEIMLKKRNIDLLNKINETSQAKTLNEKMYQILNDFDKRPICKTCGKNEQNYGGLKLGYSGFCSKSCGTKNKELNLKLNIKDSLKNSTVYDREKTVIELNKIKDKIFSSNLTQSLIALDINLITSIEYHTHYIKERSFKEKYYHILNDLKEIPKCRNCNDINDTKFLTVEKGYTSPICKKCSDEKRGEKISERLKETKRISSYDINIKILSRDNEILTEKKEFIKEGILTLRHKDCGKIYSRKLAYLNGCPFCAKIGKSAWEKEVNTFIVNELNLPTLTNKKPLKKNKKSYEIDILIPEYNIGIECNGLYFHSELSGNKNKNYHIQKTNAAKEQLNIQLLHIFDNEWNEKKEIIKSIIRNKLRKNTHKIYARNCRIKEVSTSEKNSFLDENHLQGKDKSKVKLGLFYNDELVSLMTFGERKITHKKTFELLRFCNKINTNVIGGASKLFKHFLNNFWEGQEITTYADLRYSTGNLYTQLGFEFSHSSKPNYWYTKNYSTLEHRSKYMKHKLINNLETYDDNLSEWENMKTNNYDRIWDCGNMVFKYKHNKE